MGVWENDLPKPNKSARLPGLQGLAKVRTANFSFRLTNCIIKTICLLLAIDFAGSQRQIISMQEIVLQQPDGEILWIHFQGGSLAAFAQLYNTHVQALYNYGRRFTGDAALVEDCIQDVFIGLWHKREQLGKTDSPKYYLLASLRNRLFRQLAEKNRRPLLGISEKHDFEVELSHECTLVSEQLSDEQKSRLEQAIRQLTKRQREVVFLKFYENLSYDEIASLMSLEVRSAYNLVSKAIETIRQNLGGFYLFIAAFFLR